MGHLGGLFLLVGSLICLIQGAAGHSLPACREQLEFRCGDGSCIPRLSVCDGHTDCEDGSDENRCGHLMCKKDEFTCGPSDTCLPRNQLCDGRADCRDGRDESREWCGLSGPRRLTSPTCTASEFQCGDGKCISQSMKCDRSPDCSDGSDEDNCYEDECEVNKGGCSHNCVNLGSRGFLCTCPANMRLVGDSRCEEVDSCLESDVCDQLCVHIAGNLTCDCHEDYQMNLTTGECKAKGNDALLVFTSSRGVTSLGTTGTEYRELAPHVPGPGPVAALASNRMLYWAPQRGGSIYRLSMDGKPQNPASVLRVQGSASGLSVDWIHQLLYWTSVESSSVNVGLLDGSAQRPLITGLDEPSAVAVDPVRGLLFWAQCGRVSKIERSSLDGRDRMDLVTYAISRPVALSLDVPRQLLYWVDQGTRSISRVTLEGRDRKTVVESNGYLDRPFGLTVFEDFVYWSEEVTRSICRANKRNGRNFQVLLSNATSPGGVVVIQPVLQPNGPPVCGRNRTPCQHRCTVALTSDGPKFSCARPDTGQNASQETPAISRAFPASDSSDPTFAGILSLIMFFSVLLVGMTLWWWREEFRPSRSLTEQSFSLKESQDPLIIQEPPRGPNTRPVKETLLKLDLDGE